MLKDKGKIKKDNLERHCRSCKKGVYKETSINDDWDGVLHCDKCGDEVPRYNSP